MSGSDVAYARRLYLGVLIAATAVSVVGNVFFAVQSARIAERAGQVEMGPIASGIAHATPPVLLLAIAEVWSVSMRVSTRGPSRHVWSQRAVIAIMLASFVLSAQALFQVGTWAHVPPLIAWLAPVMVDLTIVVAAEKLWALSADRLGADDELSVDGVSTTVDDDRRVGDDGLSTTTVDGVTTSPNGHVDGLSTSADEVPRAAVDEDVAAGDDEPTDSADDLATDVPTATRHPADLARQVGELPTTITDDLVVDGVTTADELVATTTALPADEHVDELPDDRRVAVDRHVVAGDDEVLPSAVDLSVDGVTTADDEWRRVADDITSSAKITATVEELATVLRLDAEGRTKQAIADEVSRSRSTIAGWLRTAEEARSLAAVR